MGEAIRDGYGKGLLAIASDKNVVVLDADLQDSTRALDFGKVHPDRFFTMGISEADMVCTAAGLATCGKKPFASSFSCFLIGRALDQILVSVAYSNLNVKLVGSHAGLATGSDGPTAQAIMDIATMRAMPRMVVVVPADAKECEKATITLSKYDGPAYLRMARESIDPIYDDNYDFKLGKGHVLKEGKDVTIIACGMMVTEALEAAKLLEKENVMATVINMTTIKPIDKDLIIEIAKKTGAIVTAEDHNIIGGLGSAVEEVVAENIPIPIKKIGVKDQFAESGKPAELYEKYGLSARHIAEAAKVLVKRK